MHIIYYTIFCITFGTAVPHRNFATLPARDTNIIIDNTRLLQVAVSEMKTKTKTVQLLNIFTCTISYYAFISV